MPVAFPHSAPAASGRWGLWGWVVVLALVPLMAWADGLFGTIEIRSNRVASIPKWVDVLARIQKEDLLGQCTSGLCKTKRQRWYEMVQDARTEGRFNQMVLVNRWVNRASYIEDINLWGKSDFWETPGLFVDKNGDCEDYAITKYYTLKALGWPEESLRLVVLHDAVRDMPHAVLAVTLNDENYILDNLATEPLPDRYLKQYTPYYAVNATTRWVFIKPSE